VWFDGGLPDVGPRPGRTYDGRSLWWRHEDLHRATLRDYAALLPLYRAEQQALEARLRDEAVAARTPQERARCSREAFDEAARAEDRWLDVVRSRRPAGPGHGPFARAWRSFDRAAARTEERDSA
jgi:hypothetical protein